MHKVIYAIGNTTYTMHYIHLIGIYASYDSLFAENACISLYIVNFIDSRQYNTTCYRIMQAVSYTVYK